jgi:NAD(P)-dependent dehydrogenase (short-subunit alcohol dehydrogenase family)
MDSAKHIRGRTAIVTGAGRGFGQAIALRLASEGARVVVTSRSQNQLDETVARINAAGGAAISAAGDVTNRSDVERVVKTAETTFGPVSILVSNAGNSGPFGPVWWVDPDRWWNDFSVHLRGLLLFAHAVLPGMTERKDGRIVCVSALAATVVGVNMSSYCVAKSAQVRLVAHIAAEGKDSGIRAFAIEPGTVATPLADATIDNPDAQRWVPGMVERLGKLKAETNPAGGLAKCADLCFKLSAGYYDALSGQYMDVREDIVERNRHAAAG